MKITKVSLCVVAASFGLSTSAMGQSGLEPGQEASVSASLSGGGYPAPGYYGVSPSILGPGPGTAAVNRSATGDIRNMSYSVSGTSLSQPLGGAGAPITLRASASLAAGSPVAWTGSGNPEWSLYSLATAADRFIIPWVGDGSTFVTMTFEGRISGTQSRLDSSCWSSAYLIGNPGLSSQRIAWQSVLADNTTATTATFAAQPFSFAATIGVDTWGWMAGLQLIAAVGSTGERPGPFSMHASSDFGSTVVVDRIIVRSGRTNAILAPGQFTMSTQSGIDYTPFIVPAPGTALGLMLGVGLCLRRRR